MSSTPSLRNGIAPSRPSSTTPIPASRNSGFSTPRAVAPVPDGDRNESSAVAPTARRTLLPERYVKLEPARPLTAINDDPVFNTTAAAQLLGVSVEKLKKDRNRDQGPDYIQYGPDGPVRYTLSALMRYRAEHTVQPGKRKMNGKKN